MGDKLPILELHHASFEIVLGNHDAHLYNFDWHNQKVSIVLKTSVSLVVPHEIQLENKRETSCGQLF